MKRIDYNVSISEDIVVSFHSMKLVFCRCSVRYSGIILHMTGDSDTYITSATCCSTACVISVFIYYKQVIIVRVCLIDHIPG